MPDNNVVMLKLGVRPFVALRIVLGIGKRTKIDRLEIRWPQPGGAVERFTDLPIDRYITIIEGQGKWR